MTSTGPKEGTVRIVEFLFRGSAKLGEEDLLYFKRRRKVDGVAVLEFCGLEPGAPCGPLYIPFSKEGMQVNDLGRVIVFGWDGDLIQPTLRPAWLWDAPGWPKINLRVVRGGLEDEGGSQVHIIP